MPLLRECIKPGITVRFPISIDTTVCNYNAKNVVEAIRNCYANYQKEFMHCFPHAPRVKGNSATFFIGGGSGYVSKTCTYAILHGREAQKVVSTILNETLPRNNRIRRQHGHINDIEKGASPHTLKCTRYNGELMQMGACCVTKMKRVPREE